MSTDDRTSPALLSRRCARCGERTTSGRFCIRCGADQIEAALGETMPAAPGAAPATEPSIAPAVPVEDPVAATTPDRATPRNPDQTEQDHLPAYADRFSPDRRLGRVIGGGRYRIDAVIGQGGFGTVYRGTHLAIGEAVAIKYLHAELATHAELRHRFRREARALARLRHPGIVAAHDFGEDGNTLYLVMELIAGESLQKNLVIDGRPMPIERTGAIFDQVLQVLEVAHAEGIVHRDMKPENVLLLRTADRAEHVKVLDFGIALMDEGEGASRLTATGVVQGTPLYMSPEQCRGRDVGPKADVYAVGVMLFEALCGETPFGGDSATDLMVKHMFIDPPSVAERGVRPKLAPALEALVRRALAKKPADRPTAAELRDALAQALAGTDAVTFAEKSRDEKIAALSLPREERGLPAPAPTQPDPQVSASARVLLWQVADSRADGLVSALAVHGLRGVSWAGEGLPPVEKLGVEGQPVRAIVLAGDRLPADRTAALRADPATAKLPVLVIDVAQAEDTPALIRAGASDVALALVGDDAVCKKVKRLVQRGR